MPSRAARARPRARGNIRSKRFLTRRSATFPGADELHIVGGLHPDLPFDYYVQMLRGLKQRPPHVHLNAFTAVEIAHFVKISKGKKRAPGAARTD